MERKISKIWVYLKRLSSFLEMSENRHYRYSQPKNAVPFATGSCRKFKPEVLVEWKAPNFSEVFVILFSFFCYVCVDCPLLETKKTVEAEEHLKNMDCASLFFEKVTLRGQIVVLSSGEEAAFSKSTFHPRSFLVHK